MNRLRTGNYPAAPEASPRRQAEPAGEEHLARAEWFKRRNEGIGERKAKPPAIKTRSRFQPKKKSGRR